MDFEENLTFLCFSKTRKMAFRVSIGRCFKNLYFPIPPGSPGSPRLTMIASQTVERIYINDFPEPLCYLRSAPPPPPPPPTCKRCGRDGHIYKYCIAKYDVGGEMID